MTVRTIRRADPFAREDRREANMRRQAIFKPVTTQPRGMWRNYSRRFNRYQLHTLQPTTRRGAL